MSTQLAFHDDDSYEVEQHVGATGRSFPVVITPTSYGAIVDGPDNLEYAAEIQPDGSTVVALRFTRG